MTESKLVSYNKSEQQNATAAVDDKNRR